VSLLRKIIGRGGNPLGLRMGLDAGLSVRGSGEVGPGSGEPASECALSLISFSPQPKVFYHRTTISIHEPSLPVILPPRTLLAIIRSSSATNVSQTRHFGFQGWAKRLYRKSRTELIIFPSIKIPTSPKLLMHRKYKLLIHIALVYASQDGTVR
jgi:hypothetical protein